MKMITKHIISENFVFTESDKSTVTTREELFSLIDRWKYLLVSRGAKRGDSLGVSMIRVNANHLGVLFAAAELGLSIIILDKPVVEETIDRTKAKIFSPIDFHITCEYVAEMSVYMQMIDRYCKHNIFENEIDSVTEEFADIWCRPHDRYILAASSGTTGDPIPYAYTHEECYGHIIRCAKIFKYEKNSKICHTRNMNHVSSLIIGMLPTFYACDVHYFFNIYHKPELLPKFINDNNIDRIFLGSEFAIRDLANNAMQQGIRFDVMPIGSISGFPLPEHYIDYCRDLNMEIMSHIGAVGVSIAIIMNHLTKDSIHEDNLLGVMPDDYYKIDMLNGEPWVSCQADNFRSKRILEDHLRLENDKWYYDGRLAKHPLEDEVQQTLGKNCNIYLDYLVIWDSEEIEIPEKYHNFKVYYLNKELWTTETKVNAYQLRGYLDLQQAKRDAGLSISQEPAMKESVRLMMEKKEK